MIKKARPAGSAGELELAASSLATAVRVELTMKLM
jgi:hypothetical protein